MSHRFICSRLEHLLNTYAENHCIRDSILGAGGGGQPLDIGFTISQVLEKGRDRHNCAAVCQADIASYHDCIAWGMTLRGLLIREVPRELAVAALMLHRCPTIVMRIGPENTRPLRRSRGVLTGSSSAGNLARVLQEDTLLACRSSWQNRAFDVGGGYRLAVMAWSDNLYAFGRSLEDAVSILSDWADALYACAGYEIKPDSLEATTSSTKRSPERTFFWQGRAWKVRDHLTCLGYTISSVGDIERCKTKFIQQLHGCFWANSKVLLNRLAPADHKMRHWIKISKGIGDYRFALWPFQSAAAKSVDAAGGKVAQLILGARPRPTETKESFCKRRNAEAKLLTCGARARLSDHWALKVVTWLEHLARHPGCPASRLLQEQTPLWLETCRVLSGRSFYYPSDSGGQTMTRSGRGQPVRYLSQWWEQIKFDNPNKDRGVSRRRAHQLKELVMRPS